MLHRIGHASATHPERAILLWLVVLVASVVLAGTHGGKPQDNFEIPGSSAQAGLDLLESHAPALAGTTAQVVFKAPAGQKVTDPANQAAIEKAVTALRTLPGLATNGVSDPFANPAAQIFPNLQPDQDIPGTQIPSKRIFPLTVSEDGSVALSSVTFTAGASTIPDGTYTRVDDSLGAARSAGMAAVVGGPLADLQNPATSVISEHADEIGLLFAVIVLLLSLGTVTGMIVPICTALFSLTVAASLTTVLEGSVEIGSVGPALGIMMGLGVGIDYSLFIVSRYRQNLGQGMDVPEAVASAIRTSGSAVLFAGITVCLALCGLYLIGVPYIGNVGFVAAFYVIVTMAAALTLLPAVLGWLGHRIDSLRLPWHKPIEAETPEVLAHTISARWAREVAKRKWLFAAVSLLVLLLLSSPIRNMQLGMTSDADAPKGQSQRTAYDLVDQAFGPGQNGPLFVVLEGAGGATTTQAAAAPGTATTSTTASTPNPSATIKPVSLPAAAPTAPATTGNAMLDTELKTLGALLSTPGVQSATPVPLADAANLAVIAVVPTTGPSERATKDLIHDLRDRVLPQAVAGSDVSADHAFVTGSTAIVIDFAAQVQSRMALFIGAVLCLTFVLLMMVFRSLFVPVKAVIMNLLSIGASFGVLVLIFQDGWGASALGVGEKVSIVVFVPVVMFAVLFGLSMDYEVFLLSRIREEYERTGDSAEAVVSGLSNTARVITSAALIMIFVFISGSTNPTVAVKMLGLGMAIAVLVDATIVRMILVPSTMELMGKGNWWLPRWIDKILPHINVD